MSKCIIKNCPCYILKYGYCLGRGTKYCKDAIYCPIKRIVEKCKRTLSINKGFEKEFTLGKMTFAEFILKDLDIQEVE